MALHGRLLCIAKLNACRMELHLRHVSKTDANIEPTLKHVPLTISPDQRDHRTHTGLGGLRTRPPAGRLRDRQYRGRWAGELMTRIMELARVAVTAVSAAVVCSPMFLAARPRTPLRVFCIAAFEYLARLPGGTLGKRRRIALAHACDFGSLRDDYYDLHRLNLTEYRSLRGRLRRIAPEAATSCYIRQLRQAERRRPSLSASTPGIVNATIGYRTSVIDLSLRWLEAISGLSVERVKFDAIVSLVCLMQLADDLLDWKDDQAVRSPSYVTASLLEQPRAGIATPLRAQADALLQRTVGAARQDAGVLPFAVAAVLTWTFVVALLTVRFPHEAPARITP
jgi:hypothetical protein